MGWPQVSLARADNAIVGVSCVRVRVCVTRGRKTAHLVPLFPAAECDVQVSWRQFKCNGASKLIFLKNNIEAANSCSVAQTACLVATHGTCVSRESWAFPGNIYWTHKHLSGEFFIYHCWVSPFLSAMRLRQIARCQPLHVSTAEVLGMGLNV